MRKPTKKDYTKGCIFGGHLKDYPPEKYPIRYFPNPYRKRRVGATITSWIGYASNAVHYYVKVREEHNLFWDGKSWRKCHEESDNGRVYEIQTKSASYAANLPRILFKRHFDEATHEYRLERSCFR